jgi:hypothetical protein
MKWPFLVVPQQCVNPREVKGLRLALSLAASILTGEAPELVDT